jgi:uncharacterized membrane protein HdeD (DUF308 family)
MKMSRLTNEPMAAPESTTVAQSNASDYSTSVQHRPWSPAQAIALILGIVFLVLGGIALARTGVNLNDVTGKHVKVAGSTQTQLMAYIELIFGALLILAGAIPGAGRGLMSFCGVVALVFGIVVMAQPSSFYHSLGIGKGYGLFLIIVGAVLLVSSIIAPIYWSRGWSQRRRGVGTGQRI